MGQPKLTHVPIDAYLFTEISDNQRYEYHHGELLAMAGGTLSHSRICTNVSRALGNAVDDRGTCESFNSEVKVEVKRAGRYVYPDAVVACPRGKESDVIAGAIVNPRVIVEVLSAGTEAYDLNVKLRYYLLIPTVREYVVIAQDAPLITVYRREAADSPFTVHLLEGLDQVIELVSLSVQLSVRDFYKNVDLPAEEEEAEEERN